MSARPGRGAEEDDSATRRRWLLRRRQRCQCVRLTLANLGEPSMQLRTWLEGVATSTAEHGHGMSGSGEGYGATSRT